MQMYAIVDTLLWWNEWNSNSWKSQWISTILVKSYASVKIYIVIMCLPQGMAWYGIRNDARWHHLHLFWGLHLSHFMYASPLTDNFVLISKSLISLMRRWFVISADISTPWGYFVYCIYLTISTSCQQKSTFTCIVVTKTRIRIFTELTFEGSVRSAITNHIYLWCGLKVYLCSVLARPRFYFLVVQEYCLITILPAAM